VLWESNRRDLLPRGFFDIRKAADDVGNDLALTSSWHFLSREIFVRMGIPRILLLLCILFTYLCSCFVSRSRPGRRPATLLLSHTPLAWVSFCTTPLSELPCYSSLQPAFALSEAWNMLLASVVGDLAIMARCRCRRGHMVADLSLPFSSAIKAWVRKVCHRSNK
jgi:hypothetical protein